MVVGARWTLLSILETANLLEFSHTTLYRVYKEKNKHPMGSSSMGGNCRVDDRCQKRLPRLILAHRKGYGNSTN